MGCGCGKKTAPRTSAQTSVVQQTSSQDRTSVAKTYQSATIAKAPTGPVTRKTV
jgi:hypothetical protein